MTLTDQQAGRPDRAAERTPDQPQVLRAMTAVITGGTAGLGSELAKGFLSAGAQVVCASRGAHEITDLFADHRDRAAFVSADVRDPEAPQRLMAETAERFGSVDIVVANAGITRNGLV